MGPAPTPPPAASSGPGVEPARARLLRLLAAHRGVGGPTVADLVGAVGGHPNTTRHHLRALVGAGLVEERHRPSAGGRGRPASRYAVTQAGRAAASPGEGGPAAQEYVALAVAFAERLAERDDNPGTDARAIGRAWGERLVVEPSGEAPAGLAPGPGEGTATEEVVGLLERLGFSPTTEDATRSAGATVLLRTCPLLDAARRHPEVVCEVHLGLVSGALEALDAPSEGVRLAPFARPGACVLALPPTLVG